MLKVTLMFSFFYYVTISFPLMICYKSYSRRLGLKDDDITLKIDVKCISFRSWLGITLRAIRALTNVSPTTPPIKPPRACNPAKKATPPNILARNFGFMKRNPMMRPATAVEAMEMNNRLIALGIGLSKQVRYPMSLARASKTTLAAVKPKK